MLSRLLGKALEKLEIRDTTHQTSAKADELLYPTFSFPSPPRGTRSLCARCLTLLSHFITRFGDGTNYQSLKITHSPAIRDISHAVQMNNTAARKNTSECVICIKIFILFKAMQVHYTFEDSWRSSPSTDWSLCWGVDPPKYQSDQDRLHIKLSIRHKGGYPWELGGFMLHPDWSASADYSRQKKDIEQIPLIGPLDGHQDPIGGQLSLDFSSTLSTGTLSLVSSWAKECVTSHSKCSIIFGSDNVSQPKPWFPDRLVQVRRKETGALTARLVLKSNTANFPVSNSKQLDYLSLSHCWGPPPDPSAPLGGRAGSVLTENTLDKWTTALPVNDLPLAFRHAITICALLGFEYIWIDSLCILQDSRQDWETQSAVMGDVYKFAVFNIAALSSTTDYEGFAFSRDTRVVFGLWCSFAEILGRNVNESNQDRKQCVLLRGKAQLLWDHSRDIPGSTASNSALFTRAWVYQERSLARRTLGFANTGVFWACDEHSLGERPGWSGLDPGGLRTTLHKLVETMATISQSGVTEQRILGLVEEFDKCWQGTVGAYSGCNLTKHTDKLIAISSIARELAYTNILPNRRYLAGFWEINLHFQLGWTTFAGKKTPPRKRVGEEGYAAPSWSWASIESGVNPCLFSPDTNRFIAMTNVLSADVELATDYKYGLVKAGWIRLQGVLNRVRTGQKTPTGMSLTDEVTGNQLWFYSDTMEGFEIVRRGRAGSLVWMPLSVSFDHMISCSCLVLMEAEGEQYSGPKGFVKRGERVYRRLGTGSFGKLIGMLKPNDLVLSIGTYPKVQMDNAKGEELAKGFKRKEAGMQEFIII